MSSFLLAIVIILMQGSDCFAHTKTLSDFEGYQLRSPIPYLPPDISFCIVDLKYNAPDLKICEFGEGLLSGFHGHQRLYGKSVIWDNFFDFINSFNIDVFLTTERIQRSLSNNITETIAKIQEMNGAFSPNIHSLKHNYKFQIATKKHSKPCTKISESAGVILSTTIGKLIRYGNELLKQYPGVIILDYHTHNIVLNKLLTHLMFQGDPILEQYRPTCVIAPTRYSPHLAEEIVQKIDSDFLVIKPIAAWKGRGIIFTDKMNLDQTLRKILCPKDLEKENDKSCETAYWAKYKKQYFLIESFQPSQSITLESKNYDATMRVAMGIAHEHGKITIKFFGCYWKLPKKSLDEIGSFDEKHKSHIQKKRNCSAKVDQQTESEVYAILEKIMPTIYQKMIAAHTDPSFIRGIRKKINGPRTQPVIQSDGQEVC